jgi:hypothetical protein
MNKNYCRGEGASWKQREKRQKTRREKCGDKQNRTTLRAIKFRVCLMFRCFDQWEFQDPKMEVLYHIRPYFVGIFPYIGHIYRGLIYGRYLQFRFLKWTLIWAAKKTPASYRLLLWYDPTTRYVQMQAFLGMSNAVLQANGIDFAISWLY